MSGQAGKWREDQVLIICPGSKTTMAQLGCHELTPPVHRFPTRMFFDQEADGWRPVRTYKRKKKTGVAEMAPSLDGLPIAAASEDDGDNYEWVEDADSVEDAVYPLSGGRIVNMPAFLAFLDYIHSLLTTTYHNTPILLMASPQWSRGCHETITRYIFEKTKTPAFCLIHSGIATQWGVKWPHMTVIDIGFEKVDVTCIYDGAIVRQNTVGPQNDDNDNNNGSVINSENRTGIISGGEVFTKNLLRRLKTKDFDWEMAEQLKKSAICEVLAYNPDFPNRMELPTETGTDSSSTNGLPLASDIVPSAPAQGIVDNGNSGNDTNMEDKAENDGVLDVAAIVTSGNTKEFLAKKEKEKEKSKAGKRGKDKDADAAAKAIRLPNSKRKFNSFQYEHVVVEDDDSASAPKPAATTATTITTTEQPNDATLTQDLAETTQSENKSTTDTAPNETTTSLNQPDATTSADTTTGVADQGDHGQAELPKRLKRVRRDIEVGLERFTFAERAAVDQITDSIYNTIQGIDEMFMRPACWDNLVFVGNGARLRGLRENIVQTLQARHLISPSTATIFTSELPSNMATPMGTGAQTPTGSISGTPQGIIGGPGGSGVNPLLQAATTASASMATGGITDPSGVAFGGSTILPPTPSIATAAGLTASSHHYFHSQTPTSIKVATLPTYLSEWNKNGFEEVMFLGAQVVARIAFCQPHNADAATAEFQRQMSLTRVEYNEHGPKAIRLNSLLR